jgi:hypothetical protein
VTAVGGARLDTAGGGRDDGQTLETAGLSADFILTPVWLPQNESRAAASLSWISNSRSKRPALKTSIR